MLRQCLHKISSDHLLVQAIGARKLAVDEVERLLQHPEDLQRLASLRDEYALKQQVPSVDLRMVYRARTLCTSSLPAAGGPACPLFQGELWGQLPDHQLLVPPGLAPNQACRLLTPTLQTNKAQLTAAVASQVEATKSGLDMLNRAHQALLKMRDNFTLITALCAECQSLIDCHDKIQLLSAVHTNLRKTLQVGRLRGQGSWVRECSSEQ